MAANFAVLHNGEYNHSVLLRFCYLHIICRGKSCVSLCQPCSAGQRHPVKLTPMQKLSQILDTIGERTHQTLDPATCKLMYNKKQLDLSLPVRFANVPSGSTLELHSGRSFLSSSLCRQRASQSCL